jgi:pilus assembly protein Flp/PilA
MRISSQMPRVLFRTTGRQKDCLSGIIHFCKERCMFRFKGQGLVEYALIIAVVAIVAVVALNLLGGQISNMFHSMTNVLQQNPVPTATP